jgi:hypothetical protein
MSALSTVAALLSAIALYATYPGTADAKWSVYLAAAVCLCIAGWQTSSFVVGLKLQRRLKRGRQDSQSVAKMEARPSAPALKSADMSAFVEPPLVTENTTSLLEQAPARNCDSR